MKYSESHIEEFIAILQTLNIDKIEAIVRELVDLRLRGGRLFILGVGGSAPTPRTP
jgi:D-sedoheptulose 7-phosphate isomerase